jgi:membrane-bound serine protease (ClpP class)
VIVFVSPAGGRAASAGTFITMSGNIAAMAPNTTIGAATPINSDGSDIDGALGRKIENDAVAYIRGIAELRGRNADWAEDAVRDGASVNETEAVRLDVVDFVATGIEDLLAKSDGRQVEVPNEAGTIRSLTLRTAGAATVENSTSVFEEILDLIADPNVAFLLLSLGGLALISEIFHPTGVAGIFGVIALALAWFALGVLPTNWAAVGLIAFGFVLIVAEIFVSGFGALGIGGALAIALGGLFLTGSGETGVEVSRWLVFGIAGVIGAWALLIVGAIMKARRQPAHSGPESLIGAKGTARTRLNPDGAVWIAGERWDATAADGDLIEDGTPVIVTAKDGLHLVVKRDPASVKLLPQARASQPE